MHNEARCLNYESVLQEKCEVALEKNYRVEEQMAGLSSSFLHEDTVWNALYEFKV